MLHIHGSKSFLLKNREMVAISRQMGTHDLFAKNEVKSSRSAAYGDSV